jgi:hypothetical protein
MNQSSELADVFPSDETENSDANVAQARNELEYENELRGNR